MMMANKKRDYKKEYKDFHGTDEQKKNRAQRNKLRRKAIREGKVEKGDGKEIDHIKSMKKGGGNGKGNIRIVSKKTNRKKGSK